MVTDLRIVVVVNWKRIVDERDKWQELVKRANVIYLVPQEENCSNVLEEMGSSRDLSNNRVAIFFSHPLYRYCTFKIFVGN